VLYNFFAVVIEATFPHKSPVSGRYFCTLRVADTSSPFTAEGLVDTCTLVLVANKFEELPISQRVGDIIRVHRATVSDFEGTKQLRSRIYYNSAWALFAPTQGKDFLPFSHLGKTYSELTPSQRKAITDLRAWTQKAFKKLSVLGKRAVEMSELETYHDEGKEDYHFDLVGKVTKITRVNERMSEI
jgi:hypothetical protein